MERETYSIGSSPGSDVVIKGLGEILRRQRRATDAIARFGGEEFLIVLPETDLNGATIAAERFRLLIADMMIPAEGHTIKITASFGIASLSAKPM